MLMNGVYLEYNIDLLWQSDWDGQEVGFDDINIVGLYTLKETTINFYIDMESNKILTSWDDCEFI